MTEGEVKFFKFCGFCGAVAIILGVLFAQRDTRLIGYVVDEGAEINLDAAEREYYVYVYTLDDQKFHRIKRDYHRQEKYTPFLPYIFNMQGNVFSKRAVGAELVQGVPKYHLTLKQSKHLKAAFDMASSKEEAPSSEPLVLPPIIPDDTYPVSLPTDVKSN